MITVCDEASAGRCPVFPGSVKERMHWSVADPSALKGTPDEKLVQVRQIRDAIKAKIEEWLKEIS